MATLTYEDIRDEVLGCAYDEYLRDALSDRGESLATLLRKGPVTEATLADLGIDTEERYADTNRWDSIDHGARTAMRVLVEEQAPLCLVTDTGGFVAPFAWADGTASLAVYDWYDRELMDAASHQAIVTGRSINAALQDMVLPFYTNSPTCIDLEGPTADPLGLARLIYKIASSHNRHNWRLYHDAAEKLRLTHDEYREREARIEDVREALVAGATFVNALTGETVFYDHDWDDVSRDVCGTCRLTPGWQDDFLRGGDLMDSMSPTNEEDTSLREACARVVDETVPDSNDAPCWADALDRTGVSNAIEAVAESLKASRTPENLRAEARNRMTSAQAATPARQLRQTRRG